MHDKVEAMRNAPRPTNVTELQSFLELVQYYAKFITNKSTTLYSLYTLFQAGAKWSRDADTAFTQCKSVLSVDILFSHYYQSKGFVLATDTSQYGIRAVRSNRSSGGSEKPVALSARLRRSTRK